MIIDLSKKSKELNGRRNKVGNGGEVMTNEEVKSLCMSLMLADSEEEVIRILKECNLWNNDIVWRSFDDNENNYSSIGNQQSSPDAALVEKIINSVDARLMNECLVLGIEPEESQAPPSIAEAVKIFFGGTGRVKDWTLKERTEIAKSITMAATGFRASIGNPCFSIADQGEGQTPMMMPLTFLSLAKSNKLRVPFVQGKFNMGGTGVLKFCGHNNFQFILSRRNPAIVAKGPRDKTDYDWGFTIVRRVDPDGRRRNSMYVYLAPIKAELSPYRGDILHFSSISMPIFPEDNNAYARESEWGSLVKLYEYTGFRSHILMKDGLLRRVDLLLPEVALPVRFHECRLGFRGDNAKSFATNLNGLIVRMEDDRGDNLEEGFGQGPGSTSTFKAVIDGEHINGILYAFKKGKAETYRKNEGVIFMINGQTHGDLPPDFFRRKNTGMTYLADSLLVVVDCSNISGRAREDLFMNSRDRLSKVELRSKIEEELSHILKTHEGLRELQAQRRREEIESLVADSKPLEKILESVLKKSPTLAALFLRGQRISNPFKAREVSESTRPFKGKRYPTYFKFIGKDWDAVLHRQCHINMRCRIAFETDAENDYFKRDTDQGEFTLSITHDGKQIPVSDCSVTLHNGVANLTIKLPANCQVGDTVKFISIVTDSTRVFPFRNDFDIEIKEAADIHGKPGSRRKSPDRKQSGNEREVPDGIALPDISELRESDWNTVSPPFNKFSALRVRQSSQGENDQICYDFFINLDNIYLKNEQKGSKKDVKLLEARFKYALVLFGLALLQENPIGINELAATSDTDDDGDIEMKIENISKSIAPIILPMIDTLGDLQEIE